MEEDHLSPTPQARHSAGIRMIDFHLFVISNVKIDKSGSGKPYALAKSLLYHFRMREKIRLKTLVVLLALIAIQLAPVSQSQAWFGNSKCKKAVASANKSVDDAVLSRVIVNNRKCFDPIVVANAQLCMKWDWNTKKPGWMINQFACMDLPSKFK